MKSKTWGYFTYMLTDNKGNRVLLFSWPGAEAGYSPTQLDNGKKKVKSERHQGAEIRSGRRRLRGDRVDSN